MPRAVLLLHSSAGLYGADVQLLAIVRGLDPQRWRPVCVVPEDGPLRPLLEQAGAEVVVHPLAVLRRALAGPRGAVTMARAMRRDRRVLGDLARERDVAVVHDNTSVVLAGGAVAR
ncbi:MAG: glycosyltransferase family 1 protein, partial [Thermoleophilaceae bacterium]